MSESIKIKSTSKNSAIGEDIILRSTTTTRFLFRPEIVNNPRNKKASVRGTFIFQKKGITGDWEDHKEFDLTKLRKSEWVKLELKAGELFQLITELNNYYQIFDRYGIKAGETEVLITSQNVQEVIKQIIRDKVNLNRLLEQGGTNLLTEIIKWLSGFDNTASIIEQLKKLNANDLEKLSSMISLNGLNGILDVWKNNKNNRSEEFWQRLFKNNSWVLAQLFSHPMIIINDKAYVGGKGIDNQGGNIVDFIYKNRLTENTALIEIKTPATKLLSGHYRGNIFAVSSELSGSVTQILTYKDELQKNYRDLTAQSKQTFQVFNPKCFVVIGCLETERFSDIQQKSFEIFRSDLRSVEILTFDELFNKVEQLLRLFQLS